MKFGHLRSLQTHVRRHPPPVSRRAGAYRLTGHITCTSAGLVQAMLGWLTVVRRAACRVVSYNYSTTLPLRNQQLSALSPSSAGSHRPCSPAVRAPLFLIGSCTCDTRAGCRSPGSDGIRSSGDPGNHDTRRRAKAGALCHSLRSARESDTDGQVHLLELGHPDCSDQKGWHRDRGKARSGQDRGSFPG
jgi:hypothetical protein